MKRPDKRKFVNWEDKSDHDDERISKRLDGRTLLSDEATTKNDSKQKTISPATTKAPAIKIRKKIKEVYDEEDEDEEDSVYAPFFDISLIEDNEQELTKDEKKEQEMLSITKEQQLISKLNIIMNTALDAEKMGLSSKLTQKDFNRINNAKYNPKELKIKTIEEKIEKPLDLKENTNEKTPRIPLDALKKLAKELPEDTLEEMFIESINETEQTKDQEEMAKLILNKSGRTKPQKNISEIITESENIKKVLIKSHEKE